MTRVPPNVGAVFFDAVGTLISPEPPAAEVYLQFGRKFGSRRLEQEIHAAFSESFRRQELLDATRGHVTNEERELDRWRVIVAEVLGDMDDLEQCFQALHAHFAAPAAWQVEEGATEVVRRFTEAGLLVGVASNFDYRLRSVLAGLGELSSLLQVISSEVGWKKPAAGFFARLAQAVDLPPSRILFIGDDFENDYQGARAAGLHALLLDPKGRATLPAGDRLSRLSDLLRGG